MQEIDLFGGGSARVLSLGLLATAVCYTDFPVILVI